MAQAVRNDVFFVILPIPVLIDNLKELPIRIRPNIPTFDSFGRKLLNIDIPVVKRRINIFTWDYVT